MKLFVDYTNWKGIREWREIDPETLNDKAFKILLDKYPLEDGSFITTYIMHVSMVDRGNARRTLRVDHIHGFRTES
jgi:hypothetical protein